MTGPRNDPHPKAEEVFTQGAGLPTDTQGWTEESLSSLTVETVVPCPAPMISCR